MDTGYHNSNFFKITIRTAGQDASVAFRDPAILFKYYKMKLYKVVVILMVSLSSSLLLTAQNPIIQTCYTADPAPMIHNNVFYIYTGHDEEGADYFQMNDWHVYSSTDMVNWTDHGPRLFIEDFSWAEKGAWASQCVERNGKFYWYICAREKGVRSRSVGVAVGDTPLGPFHDPIGRPLASGNMHLIDPTVWIDNDDCAHLYFGNRQLWYAELNKDMITLKNDTFQTVPLTYESFGNPIGKDKEKEYRDNFEEGAWLMKHAGKYYMLYAAGGIPEHISYSMSDSPRGPWKYMGHVMDRFESGSATNHCGIAEYKGRTYFVYHTGKLPGGSSFTRSVAIEEFKWNDDGTLPLIKPTPEGVEPVGTLNAYERIEAETIAFSGGVHTEPSAKTGVYVSDIHHGDSINVRVVDFGNKPPKYFIASAASALMGGLIEVRLDNPNGALLATLEITSTGGWEAWQTFETKICHPVTGVHDLYFKFKGNLGAKLFNYDWWIFKDKTITE